MQTGLRVLPAVALIAGLLVVGARAEAAVYNCIGSRGEGIQGSDGSDVLFGTAGDDVIHAGDGDDEIHGLGGADLICAGRGGDTIHGGNGSDFLVAGGGDDTLLGGDGEDWLFPMTGDDIVDGGPEFDDVHMYTADGPVTVDLEAGTATGDGNDTIEDVEEVWGSEHGSTMIGDPSANGFWTKGPNNTIEGRGGDDEIRGLDGGTQTLSGEGGNDRILAWGNGPDIVSGGPGDDDIEALGGDHTIDGNGGDDSIEIRGGPVDIDGGDGVDELLFSQPGNHAATVDLEAGRISGGAQGPVAGIENVSATSRNDFVRGNAAPNRLEGSSGDDGLFGRQGNDYLAGSLDRDRLAGGEGDDVLVGGKHRDTLNGGAGWDSCSGEVLRGCETTHVDDPDDTFGPIDVRHASATLAEREGVRTIHLRFTSHERFESGEFEVARIFLSPHIGGENRRTILVFNPGGPRENRLRANLISSNGNQIRRLEITRPGPKSVQVVLAVSDLPPGVEDGYAWDLRTMSDAEGCWLPASGDKPDRNRCVDDLRSVKASISP